MTLNLLWEQHPRRDAPLAPVRVETEQSPGTFRVSTGFGVPSREMATPPRWTRASAAASARPASPHVRDSVEGVGLRQIVLGRPGGEPCVGSPASRRAQLLERDAPEVEIGSRTADLGLGSERLVELDGAIAAFEPRDAIAREEQLPVDV